MRSYIIGLKFNLIFTMFNLFKTANLSENQKATRRISLFTCIVIAIMVMGVFGMFPNNSLEILSPLNGLVCWFALGTVFYCILSLFNKEKVPGKKEFSDMAYVALLFTLGMGVGIMVYGFNEAPSLSTYEDVRNPIGLVVNHWTVIPWCIYVTFATFEIYDAKYKLIPNWLRTIKNYLYGLVMMLGIGTSFALGVITISGSLMTIYGIDVPSYALVVMLGAAVTFSLLRGLHRGMKMMATISMYLLYAFIIVLAIVAPKDTMVVFAKSLGSFVTDFFYFNVYRGAAIQNDWTVYYWVWWISWAAFCAPFIQRISRGRTIRSVTFFTVIIPTILTAIYMILGNNIGMHLLANGVETAMIPYKAIDVHWILPVFFIILMSMFYITSSDSQSFAMDSVISKGSSTPIKYRKILWVFLEVLFVTVLLLAGGGTVSALQGLSFLAVPFMILFAFYMVIRIALHLKKNGVNAIEIPDSAIKDEI